MKNCCVYWKKEEKHEPGDGDPHWRRRARADLSRVFHDNQNYNDDPAVFEAVYEELLRLLEEGGKA